MFSKTQSPEQNLRIFREFRQNFPESGTSQDVVNAFSSIRIQSRYLDYYTPESWPNIFDIISGGLWCQTGVTLVMASVLHHLCFLKTDILDLRAISNHTNGADGIVLFYNGQCYNFSSGEIVSEKYANDHSIVLDQYKIAPDKLFR
jgi:hypothetical protein